MCFRQVFSRTLDDSLDELLFQLTKQLTMANRNRHIAGRMVGSSRQMLYVVLKISTPKSPKHMAC